MRINILAAGHKHQEKLREYYNMRLNKQYGKYEFIQTINFRIKSDESNLTEMGLELLPKGRPALYVSSMDANEMKAFAKLIRRMKTKLMKFKVRNFENHKSK